MSDTQKINWSQTLSDKVCSFAEELGLDDIQTNRFKDFAFTVAKEQYKIGNKYGASWAFKKAREETGQAHTIAAKPAT